jgi:hypothetical protein
MGQEILYCFKCRTRIVGADFAKGGAFQVGNRVSCSACAAELLRTLPPEERERFLPQMFKATRERRSSGSGTTLEAMDAPLGSSPSRMNAPVIGSSSRLRATSAGPPGGVERRRSRNTVRRLWEQRSRRNMALAAAAAVLLVAVVIVLLNSGGGRSPGSDPAPGAPLTKVAPALGPAAATAEPQEVRKAREFARDYPRDLEGQIAQWRGALLTVDPKTFETVQKELGRLLAVQKEAVAKALAELEVQTKPYLDREEFAVAADLLQTARARFASPEWILAVDRKIEKARSDPARLLPGLLEKAADARRRGAADEIGSLGARVRKWGRRDLASDFEAALAAAPGAPTPAPAPAPSPAAAAPKELEAYRTAWEAAFGRAAAGDLRGAAEELAAATQGLPEGPVRAESAEDLEAIRRAAGAAQEIREALSRTAKGQKVSLERWNDLGAPEKVEGTVLAAEPGRLVLRSEAGTIALEIGELTLVAIADQILARPARKPGEDRTAALLALLGGDQERADRLKVELPERWRKFSPRAASATTVGREAEARRLYVEAEEAAADPSRVATALRNTKTLLADYAGTAFVVRNKAALGARPNLGKEYLFFPDTLRGAGTFKPTKAGKLDSAWLSERDSDAAATPQNYVELSFTALADSEYRLWVYAGACCLETFAFGVQGTEMVLPSARATAAEPGGAAWVPVRPTPPLKKTHAMHNGPKSPARWEWIPIPVPKYASPGVKVVRILTDQQGFAVATASVSALTSSPPRESDLKDLEKFRPRGRPTASEKEIPGLVAHWRFDEGAGESAAEALGKLPPATLHGASWATGRWGAGLRFDGGNSWADLPSAPALDRIAEGSYTVAAWFQADGLPPGQGDEGNASYGIVIRTGLHTGLYYGNNGSFSFMQWFVNPDDPSKSSNVWTASGGKGFPPNVFHHVAGVLDRDTGKALIYVNGKQESSNAFPSQAKAWNYGSVPWRVGIGGPNYPVWRWCTKGVVDEVRFYSRALGAAEVEALSRGPGRAPAPPDAARR